VNEALAGAQSKNANGAPEGEQDEPVAQKLPIHQAQASPLTVRNQVFISYSHKDRRWLEQLQTMLKPYIRGKSVRLWEDTSIAPGAKWTNETEVALARAKVALLIVSPNFLASEFIAHHEMPTILEAAKKEGTVILWVAVSASAYKETEIRHYQAANNPAAPLDSMGTARRNQEWVRICDCIKEALNS
jgi:internalin A